MQASPSPLSIGVTLSAAVTTEPGREVTVPLVVHNAGTDALTVTGKIVFLTGAAKSSPVPASWHAQLSPASFTLQPGKDATETLTFRVPAHATGLVHVLNYEFAGQVGGSGSVHLSGAVAGTLTVHTPQAAPPPPGTSTPVIVVSFILLACLLTVAFLLVRRVVRLVRKLRHRRSPAPSPAPEQNARVPR